MKTKAAAKRLFTFAGLGAALLAALGSGETALAACGATTITWDGTTSQNWNVAANWTPANVPDLTTENAYIATGARSLRANFATNIACLEMAGGTMSTNYAVTLGITGDYFRNLNAGSISATSANFILDMRGNSASPQSLENVDPIGQIRVTNTNASYILHITQPFKVNSMLDLTTGMTAGKVLIESTLDIDNGSASNLTIPNGVTVEIANGGKLRFRAASGGAKSIIVQSGGTLKIQGGGALAMANGTTLNINLGGNLILNGSASDIARIEGDGATSFFTFTMSGTITANYFKVTRATAAGMNVASGATISSLGNGEFHYIPANGYGITLGATASFPGTMDGLGFFNENGNANVRNFNASAYTGGQSTSLTNYTGDRGGATYENDSASCGGGCLNWGSAQSVKLLVNNVTANGSPPETITPATTSTFLTLGFSLNQASTATSITSITFQLNGTATGGDLDTVAVYKDNGTTNCVWDASDTLIGTYTPSGSNGSFTVSGISGVSVSGVTPVCIHVLASPSAIATNGATIAFKVASSSDVTNSQSYSFSDASGPPVVSDFSQITGASTTCDWRARTDTTWNTAANWTCAAVPTLTENCDIGPANFVTTINTTPVSCQSVRLITGGTLATTAGAKTFQIYGNFEGQSGFTYSAAYPAINFVGSVDQSAEFSTTFPGNVTVNQGAAGHYVNINANSTIGGTLTITQGTVKVANGITLTVTGGITINGGTLDVQPGGTVKIGDGAAITVSSGTLKVVGDSTTRATVTSDAGASKYTVTVQSGATISARYYTFDHLGVNGVTINSGATINASNFLQDGSFTYPVANSSTLLRLYTKIPGDTLTNMSFDAAGSGATSIKSIYTDAAIAPAGTLTVSTYSGTLAGVGTDNSSASYPVAWSGAVNTLDLTRQAGDAGPASVNAGTTYFMGRFRLNQTNAGASYADTNITSVKLTMTGTASGSDVSAVRLYYDSTCAATSGGTLVGSGTFSGSPGTITFSSITGVTLSANPSVTVRCLYVEYDIAAGATNGATVGGKINANADVVNSQSYAFNTSAAPPVTLGSSATIVGSTTTTWTGSGGAPWNTAGSWSSGIPDSTKNCTINSTATAPVIPASYTASCKTVTIGSGATLTMTNATSTLRFYQNFANSGTFTMNSGALEAWDGGSALTQTVSSSSTLTSLSLTNKTASGASSVIKTGGSFTITNQLVLPASTSFEFQVVNGHTLTLSGGLSVVASTMNVQSGGTISLANGQSISVTGGTFKTSGTNDAYSQGTANKGKVTAASGTWSFLATSGTVSLTGFLLDKLDANGLRINGSTTLSALSGGQFTNLLNAAANPGMKVIQLNTTSSPGFATASNVGWEWQAANSVYLAGTSPALGDTYYLVYTTNCNGQSITFDQWFGDFFQAMNTPAPSSKVSASGCSITIAASASPVTLLDFSATGYNGAVSVDWTTGSELDHAGFNVYRSLNPVDGFIQVNPQLIRNFNSSASFHGTYRYIDQDVINGLTYYYKIEDIATNGTRTLHGLASARPDSSLGTVPASGSSVNQGGSSGGAGTGNSAPSGSIDLGNGVHILSQTRNLLRLEVVPPSPVYSASSWNASYQALAVAGYSKTLEAGKPELAERDILIEVEEGVGSVSLLSNAVTESAVTSHLIQPAPSWAPQGAQLVPTYAIDATAYSTAGYIPSQFFQVTAATEVTAGKTYARLKVKPVLWDPVSGNTRFAQKIVLELGLNGSTWSTLPAPNTNLAPSAVEGALRIKYAKTGIYQISYDDLAGKGVLGPFAGADTGFFRLYSNGVEVPIQVVTANGSFQSGDKVRFYLWHESSIEDKYGEAVLTLYALSGSSGAPLRMPVLNADPTGVPDSNEWGGVATASAEENLIALFGEPVGTGLDHFYWGQVVAQNDGLPLPPTSKMNLPIELPGLLRQANTPVRVRLFVKGNHGYATNPVHHLGVTVNHTPYQLADLEFTETDPTQLSFTLPHSYFAEGSNTITVQALADLVPSGEYDIVSIDRVEVDYIADRLTSQGTHTLINHRLDHALNVRGFSGGATVLVYDVTDPSTPAVLSNLATASPDGGATQTVTFAANQGPDSLYGGRFIALQSDRFLAPSSFYLGYGYPESLRSTSRGADLIVIGDDSLLDAARELISARRDQGLRVATVTPDQIYAEFSSGRVSSQAIRDFVRFSLSYWVAPAPKYLLFLGDSTYDPRGNLGYTRSRATLPAPLEAGTYLDFGSDHWFVANDDGRALMAVGRLPYDDAASIMRTSRKILDYEGGSLAPASSTSKNLIFVADSDTLSEGFETHSQALASTASQSRPGFSSSVISRTALGSDALTQARIVSAFNSSPLAITYVGHGAEDRWAGGSVFLNAQADGLTNSRLPIVVALDCLNSYTYDADPAYQSLGERLVLNSSGGAVAFWGSTTMTTTPAQVALAQQFFQQLGTELKTGGPHTARIGDLIVRAKSALGINLATSDVIRSYTLLGDPSMKLPMSAFDPATATSANREDKSGGFLSCGTTSDTGSGSGGSGPGLPELAELALLLTALASSRRLLSKTRASVRHGQAG